MTRHFLTAFLYASLALTANPLWSPATAAEFTPEFRTALQEAREGEMRKLAIHDAPRAVADITFTDPDGASHSLGETDGKVRIVNFWATWCAPCRIEKPSLDALNAALAGPDFEVIAIATGRNSEAGIKRFNEEVGIESLATYLDARSDAARQMGVLGLPVSVILDREGNEVARLQGGADWDSDSARAILGQLIAAGG